LPGTAEEKLHPYLLPLFDEIDYFLKAQHFQKLKHTRQIEVVPLGLMRGSSFHEAFIVADECQNASYEQLKMLLTRIGIDSKMVLTGDLDQSDLGHYQKEGFRDIIDRLYNTNGIGFSELEVSDIVRNPIIADIVDKL
jgi:phosphate starvation-inducible PhoH-like protein